MDIDSSLSQSLAGVSFASDVLLRGVLKDHRLDIGGGSRLIYTPSHVYGAVKTHFYCAELARRCSRHSATRVGLQLVYYQLRNSSVSMVMVENADVSITTIGDALVTGVSC